MEKQLIVYYSRPGENYFNGKIQYIKKGNTEIAAEIIKGLTGADSFRIVQKTPYSDNYRECTEEAHEDQRRNARPELTAYPQSLDGYDVIYLGFPNYWSTMPMAMFTFLEHCSMKGKTIKPFCTHEGSGQILLVTAGRGWYQEWGKDAIELKPGDTINIKPGVKHWHGASKDQWMQHIAIEVPGKNGKTEWCEPVSEEEYSRLK